MTRVAAAVVVLLSLCRVAAAADERAAEALVTRGLELRREGKPGEALEMFQRAHALSPSPRTLGQMGLVEASLGHWIDAEDHLTASLATPQDPWVKKQRTLLDQGLALARTHIGQILFTGPPGTTITVSGKTVGTLPHPSPVRLSEGNVLVSATAPGFKQFVLTVPVQANMQTPLNIDMAPVEVHPAPPPPTAIAPLAAGPAPDAQAHSWRTWAGGALVAGGAGALAWGIAWVALQDHPSGGSCAPTAPQPCRPEYNTGTAGWVLTGAGAAAAVAGGILIYTGRRHHDDDVPIMSLGPGSLSLRGRF
jgi:hypothetical protein